MRGKRLLILVMLCLILIGCGQKYNDYFSYEIKYDMQFDTAIAQNIQEGDRVELRGYLYRTDDYINPGNSYNKHSYAMVKMQNIKGKVYETNCLILIKDKNLEIPLEKIQAYDDKIDCTVKGYWSKEDYDDNNKNTELLVVEEIDYE